MPALQPRVIDASKLDITRLGSRYEIAKAAQTIAKPTVQTLDLSTPSPISSSQSTPKTLSTLDQTTRSPSVLSTTSTVAGDGMDDGDDTMVHDPALSVGASDKTKETTAAPAKALTPLEQLKEKIRQRQLEKKTSLQGSIKTPEERQRTLAASRLPSVFDLIRFKRVEVMAIKLLTEQVVRSSRMPISEMEGQAILELMPAVLPEWCQVFEVGDGSRYFKVVRSALSLFSLSVKQFL
ncbi:hypothetical protein BGW38_005340 [Lunasporangiospora selenospora]|uniref:DNA replication factor Cdt1 C-terminal domain-containing protein n=1 Tax=Lunasporangiospora selenospora TaxID=979761 RepID=A0A9P6KBE8_9FUNG|nr:hypothetical protein BGW38_005340 [Lunasporangiospora selenospora]